MRITSAALTGLFVSLLFAAAVVAAGPATLVTADWLWQHRSDRRVVILDARPQADYAKEHIPAALWINESIVVDSTRDGEQIFEEWLQKTFSQLGIGPRDHVIVYENRVGPRAAKACYMLRYAGQRDVSMLQGGLEAWRQARHPLTADAAPARAAVKYRLNPQMQWSATAKEIAGELKNPQIVLLDVRSAEEYNGTRGNADCARQGHIPGAKRIEWTEFLTPDKSAFRTPEEIRALLEKNGIKPGQQIITYCHGGGRASVVWSALENSGVQHVQDYVGSWHDWSWQKRHAPGMNARVVCTAPGISSRAKP